MSTRLVILGLLKEKPLHGYEIKQLIEERMGDWTDIAFGSIYYALDKLNDEGYIRKVATERDGNRPSRDIYEITPAGTQEFQKLLRETWQDIKPMHFDIDIGLYFANALPKSEILSSMKNRLEWVKGALHHITNHRNETVNQSLIPSDQLFWVNAIFEHAQVAYQAEKEWLEKLLLEMGG